MDKIAPAIAWVKKNIFWLGCGFLTILMLGIWFVSVGSIDKQTADATQKIKSSITSGESITRKTAAEVEDGVLAHPNKTTEKGMQEELEATVNSIIAGWKLRKEAQDELLVWPQVIRDNDNGEFERRFSQYNPPETFPDKWNSGFGLDPLLDIYKTWIPKHMEHLCEDILDTRWNYDEEMLDKWAIEKEEKSSSGSNSGFGGRNSGPTNQALPPLDPTEYAVIWADLNQDLWYEKLTQFAERDDHQREVNSPTPLQCYMLQQDLWLLEAMFKIIKEVNGDSISNDLSVIKTIDHVVFGRECGTELGELTPVDARLKSTGLATSTDQGLGLGKGSDYGEGYGDDYGEGMEPEGEGMGRGALGALFVGQVPYHQRYVDMNLNQIPAATIKGIVNGTDLPTSNLELLVAKRVPVRIAVRMDETKIGEFMAACANSDFAFEIQQVRWNRHTPGGSDISDSLTTSRGSGSLSGAGGATDDTTVKLESTPVEIRTNHDVNVEFFGIVKIYNPVRADLLRRAAGLPEQNDTTNPAGQATPESAGVQP
ncbi:MAG: hypothetical protein AAF939_17390 [Planctomycetota bacterium]